MAPDTRVVTLVWIDSREATIARRGTPRPRLSRITSDVPAHHRSTGHVRHSPTMRHGGGGAAQTAGEPRRLEHLERFLDTVIQRIPADDDVVVIGPGTTREHLARRLSERDARHHAGRRITCRASARVTPRQLVAELRSLLDEEPRRRGLRPTSEAVPAQ